MAEKFVKASNSSEEVDQLLKCLTKDGIKNSEVQDIYNRWAEHYDQDLIFLNYNPPLILANQVDEFYGNQRDISILDAAAGTGLVGKHLHEKGYKKLDALDASAIMLEKARQIDVYNQFYEAFLGRNILPIPDDSYDAVVTTGSFVPGHVNEDCYEELIRITKKGGHIFILMTERYFIDAPEYSHNLEPRMLELQDQGLWKRVLKKTNIPNYYKDQTGVLFVLKKCH